MSSFFTHFPKVIHNNTVSADISRRVKILEKLKGSPYLYQPYTVKSNETPEEIAFYYYDDASLSWLVLLANNIIDVGAQWPKTTEQFENYITNKYLVQYKSWLYDTYPNKFSVERKLMLDLFEFFVGRPRFAEVPPFTEVQEGAAQDIPNKYEKFWDYITTASNSDINDNGIINNTDFQDLQSQKIWTGEFRNFLIEFYDVEDPVRSVTDYTRDVDITDNILYYEGVFEGEQPSIKWNNETWYKNSYAEEGAIDWGFATPLGAKWSIVRIWDYEDSLNESQRAIRLIDSRYIDQVKREMRGLYR